jgi:hypothetical protein
LTILQVAHVRPLDHRIRGQGRRGYGRRADRNWTHFGFDWHVFSYRHARALAREKASFAYASLDPPPFSIICPQDERLPAFEITGGSLPDFRNSGQDMYVWPNGLDWTMAFTHEDGWLGPKLSRREWIRIPSR